MTTTLHARPATPGQVEFVKTLIAERDLEGASDESVSAKAAVDTARDAWRKGYRLNERTARLLIDYLKAAPRKAGAEAKPGYYVCHDQAFRVQMNKAGTHTYAMSWTGSSWGYAPGYGRNLAAEGLVPMTAQEAARIGLASGRCIVCCRVLGGKTLSARVAAVIGYGEICAENEGWTFPKGAATQRAYLAANNSQED